jgi:hypothetical protein
LAVWDLMLFAKLREVIENGGILFRTEVNESMEWVQVAFLCFTIQAIVSMNSLPQPGLEHLAGILITWTSSVIMDLRVDDSRKAILHGNPGPSEMTAFLFLGTIV